MAMGPQYRELHQQYVRELREAIDEVRKWWDELVNRTVETTGSRVAAAAALEKRWPAGPSAHPRILAVIHKYYVACEALNIRVRKEWRQDPEVQTPHVFNPDGVLDRTAQEPDAPIPPAVFVGESLVTASTRDLARIVGYLKYWPVGVDSSGQFV